MDAISLIPYAEAVPVPPLILIFLEQLFFLIHIILVNSILGVGLILLYKWKRTVDFFDINRPLARRIPIFFALAINMAIPALLFLQVVFGHLFYSSSVLMGTFWILIIPILIIAYYSSYFHYKKFGVSQYAKYSLILMISLVLYVAFILVNNLSMMEMPEKWSLYFSERGGTILLWSVSSIYPRFLHFIVASLAVGGIVYAFYFSKKSNSEKNAMDGIRIFAYATMVQMAVGVWFLVSLPESIMLKFMGRDSVATLVLVAGIGTAVLSVILAFKNNLKGTLIFLLITLIAMVINRYNLRIFSLEDKFSPTSLEISPQWDVFVLFVVILLIGVGVLFYMVKISFKGKEEAK